MKNSFVLTAVTLLLVVGVVIALVPVGGLRAIYALSPDSATFEKAGTWFLWAFAAVMVVLGFLGLLVRGSKEAQKEAQERKEE